MAELLQPEQVGNDKTDQQQNAFLDDISKNFKGKQEERIPLTNNKLAEMINQFFKDPLSD